MKRKKLHIVCLLPIACLWGILLLLTACEDDEYYYPPVKLEFVTVQAGGDGRMQTLIPDRGDPLPVSKDRTGSIITPNTSRRLLSNYETISEGGTAKAVIYSLQELITPAPLPATDPAYKDGIKTDPVEMVSIWMGRNYLNMILNLKVDTGKGHVFGIVEDLSEFETDGIVNLLLYHNASGDEEYYNRRAYVSVPLEKYINNHHPEIKIKFTYHTYGKDGSSVRIDKYSEPGFTYIPAQN